ncbi:conserved phage C-terminal domain-containing protein [Limosilactobacillus balticus]|uniref:Conserved phage C-terminal domain-containing protein n=2 Tax=Limosilactobacillus balticus TaxID=2759747 RepID=A0ABS8RE65_9LACO|nr:conserved phage C-terminal domain-containing protein [Limosilactobacillus balticus]MCD7138770.1 conserved phage C-terminal domain-containing protein [Limosilactobacillus balticus]
MSKLLLDERPLQVQASLAKALKSLDEAVIIQQLHYWLQRSNLVRENHRWVYNSMADWNKQFPWLTRKTLTNKFNDLEKRGLIITGNYNKAAFDKTKWYRIDYDAFSHLEQRLGKNYPTNEQDLPNGDGKNYSMEEEKSTQPIPLDYTETTQETTTRDKGQAQPAQSPIAAQRREVIQYLNQKTGKHFKPDADGNKRIIEPRLKEGYTVDEMKKVIDNMYSLWHGVTFRNGELGDNYLKPETLFRSSKIDGYLNATPSTANNQRQRYGKRAPINEPMPECFKHEQEQKEQDQGNWMDQLPDESEVPMPDD